MALVLTSLNAVTVAGPGDALMFNTPKSIFGIHVMTVGTPTTMDTILEGTIDGVNWAGLFDVGSSPNRIAGTFPASGAGLCPVMGIRANLTILTGTASVTAVISAQE